MTNAITWLVVADSAHAKIYANQGRGLGIDEPAIHEFFGDKQPTRDINSDEPGRMAAPGGAHHAMEPPTDAHRHAQQVLAREVAHALDAAAKRGAYAQVVLVAPPRMLGDLRENLSANVRAKLVGDLNKNLMAASSRELAAQLRGIVKLY